MTAEVVLRKQCRKRCNVTAVVAALFVAFSSPYAMSQGTTGGGGSAAGAAASQPGAASAPGALPPLSGNGLPPSSGNGLPPMSGNGLPPLSGNGLPPNAAGTNRANNAVNNASGAVPLPAGTPTRDTSARDAFGMLDRSGQGFVTRGDTNRISGFMGFDYADANRDGRLSPEEFENAWSFYSGQSR